MCFALNLVVAFVMELVLCFVCIVCFFVLLSCNLGGNWGGWGSGVFINLLKLAQWFWCLFSLINPWRVEPQWGLVYLGAWRGKWKELVVGKVHSACQLKEEKTHTWRVLLLSQMGCPMLFPFHVSLSLLFLFSFANVMHLSSFFCECYASK